MNLPECDPTLTHLALFRPTLCSLIATQLWLGCDQICVVWAALGSISANIGPDLTKLGRSRVFVCRLVPSFHLIVMYNQRVLKVFGGPCRRSPGETRPRRVLGDGVALGRRLGQLPPLGDVHDHARRRPGQPRGCGVSRPASRDAPDPLDSGRDAVGGALGERGVRTERPVGQAAGRPGGRSVGLSGGRAVGRAVGLLARSVGRSVHLSAG